MPAYDNIAIAGTLERAADLLEIDGADKFRVLSYRKAARAIRELPEQAAVLANEGRLTEIPGVGARMAESIAQIVSRGSFDALDSVSARIPQTLADVMHISGVGPKRAAQLHAKLGIETLDGLADAVDGGTLATVGGFGAKSAQHIAEGLDAYRRHRERLSIGDALPVARRLVADLRDAVPGADVEIVGGVRRREETVGDINLVGCAADLQSLLDAFVALPGVESAVDSTRDSATIELHGGIRADLHVARPDSVGSLVQRFTGNRAHNARLREIASRVGVDLETLRTPPVSSGGGAGWCVASESAVYSALGIALPPPEIRRGDEELDLAERHVLPQLVVLGDVRGDLQSHSTYTDGRGTLGANRAVAAELGYEYIAATDHALNLRMVGGLSPADLERQWGEIDELNARGDGPRILKGIELNIADDGSVDYDDEVLANFDIALASLHSGWDQDEATATKRLIAAIEHPWVDIIAHPTGRVIGRRDPIRLNMDAVLCAAGETGTIMEINSFPDRLDLSAEHQRLARRFNVRFSLGTDAHSPDQLRFMEYGVGQARRGMVCPSELLNAQPWQVAATWLKRSRLLGTPIPGLEPRRMEGSRD